MDEFASSQPTFLQQALPLLLVCSLVVYPLSVVLYRLLLHPLAKFPGSKWAASTKWFETYYDVLKQPGGQYFREIDRMHDKYGSIIRINPDEIHIRDPDFLEVLYAPNPTIRHKYPPSCEMAGVPLGSQGTVDHHVHKGRRMAISRMFSKRAITNAQGLIHKHVDGLIKVFEANSGLDRPIDLEMTLLAFTTDVIYDYMFDIQTDYQKNPLAAKSWKRSIDAVAQATPSLKQFPGIISRLLMIPHWILQPVLMRLLPDIAGLLGTHKLMGEIVSSYFKKRSTQPAYLAEDDENHAIRPKTLFNSIDQSNLPPHEKTPARLVQEGITILAAGSETSARVISHTIFHLLLNPDALAHVKEELADIGVGSNQSPDVRALESLPWLTACIRESLRLRAAITSRLPLILEKDIAYKEWMIPAGTPISMSLPDVLHNDEIFPEAIEFKPERWFSATEQQNRMYVPFGRGTRMCIGLDFAYIEIYLALASLLARFDFELYDTTWERDVAFTRDCFIGEASPESQGIRVKIRANNKEPKA